MKTIHSWLALLLYIASMWGAYIWVTYYPDAPFLSFASNLTIGFGAYVAKRHFDRRHSNVVPMD